MHIIWQVIKGKPANLFKFCGFIITGLARVNLHQIRQNQPVAQSPIIVADSVYPLPFLPFYGTTAIFFSQFPQHTLIRRLAKFHLSTTIIPSSPLISASTRALIEENITLPIMADSTCPHADIIFSYDHILYYKSIFTQIQPHF